MADKFELNRGLIKVAWPGGGGHLIAREAFEKIGEPYFMRIWDEKLGVNIGEDISFMRRCQDRVVDIWCDTNLHYGHLDTRVFFPE